MNAKATSIFLCLLLVCIACKEVPGKSQVDPSASEAKEKSKDKDSKKGLKLSPLDTVKLSEVERLYDVSVASQELALPMELKEISGLSFDQVNNQFLANNDEEGVIYHLDLKGNIVKKDDFEKDGDYEGIEKVGDDIVVTKSNGNLYFYNDAAPETTKVKTDLNEKNDIEGLAYDPNHNLLLMACKGATLHEKKSKHEKSIYAYNLKLRVLHEEPFLTMRDAVHLSYVEYHMGDIDAEEKKSFHKRVKDFAPSGLAINPVNRDIYVISARGSIAVVYDMDHHFQDILFFDEELIPQPEGICFSPSGDLYVSTEGVKHDAKIFKFSKI